LAKELHSQTTCPDAAERRDCLPALSKSSRQHVLEDRTVDSFELDQRVCGHNLIDGPASDDPATERPKRDAIREMFQQYVNKNSDETPDTGISSLFCIV